MWTAIRVTSIEGCQMSRRYSRVVFWVGIVACTLPAAGVMMAFSPSPDLPNVVGVWDGFCLEADGGAGLVVSDITRADFPQVEGAGTLVGLKKGDVSYKMRATMTHPDSLT